VVAAEFHTRHERVTNAVDANPERVQGDAQLTRQGAAPLDLLPARIPVVGHDQVALLRPQLLETSVEAVQALLADRKGLVRFAPGVRAWRGPPNLWLVEGHMLARTAEIL
jgi:hypothetical protein